MGSAESTKVLPDSSGRRRSPLSIATPFPIESELVAGCLNANQPRDQLFARAWRQGFAGLDRRERASIAGVTGHVAESVTEVVFAEQGWIPIWHHAGPGPHGIDLALPSPSNLVVVEVKGRWCPVEFLAWLPGNSSR